MPKFSDFLALLTGKPKTLDAAASTLDQAKGQLDSVASLFTAAGLNIDTMLAAGPDSLKANLASLGESATALAAAQAEVTNLKGQISTAATAHASALSAKAAELTSLSAERDALATVATAIGLDPKAATKPEEAKTAFEAYVKKAANLELAKTGHPPIADVVTPTPAAKTKPVGPDGKELTGLALTTAIFAANLPKRG